MVLRLISLKRSSIGIANRLFDFEVLLGRCRLLLGPVEEDHADDVVEASRRGNVQRITAVSVHEADVYTVIQQEAEHHPLLLLRSDEEAVNGVVIHAVRVGALVDQVID